ncbi:MAG: hypothetical protein H0Z30_06470 [Candidatus Marinimicrobia bacterium]|nr:hypothetical protein [Candidatus Neomarinimicrobiota bacterium]
MKRSVFILFLILLLSFTLVPLSNVWLAMDIALNLQDPMSKFGFGVVGIYWSTVAGVAGGPLASVAVGL